MPVYEITPVHDSSAPVPVRLPCPAGVIPGATVHLRGEGGAAPLSGQCDGEAVVVLLADARAGRAVRYHLEPGVTAAPTAVKVSEEGADSLEIAVPDGPFATYRFARTEPRPFFWPVHGPGGKPVTRAYPMIPNVPGEKHDHPHHRSFWTAYGEVNGVDDWSQEKGHGWIRHSEFPVIWSGAVSGGFVEELVWTSADDRPLLDELRSIHVYNVGPERRLLDYDVVLNAAYGDLHYGDTKEGGILSFRVATSMDGDRGGMIENSNGERTEHQVWGKRAAWLDYSGSVQGETLGITMMDYPGNLHHPCRWHARDYGLVGANPFANHAFGEGDASGYRQAKGETLHFRYRVLIHRGGAKEGGADEAFHSWVQPPVVRVVG